MALKTFEEDLVINRATGHPVASVKARVVDHLTGTPVITYDLDGNAQDVYTNRWGVRPAFKADCDVARITIGPEVRVSSTVESSVGLRDDAQASADAAAAAQAAAEQAAQAAQDALNSVLIQTAIDGGTPTSTFDNVIDGGTP